MACGLSYGEVLLLCTLISFDWVVHGVRVLPPTLGAEVQVVEEVEQVAKDLDLISQQVTSSSSERFTCFQFLLFNTSTPHFEQKYSVDTDMWTSDNCASECETHDKCRAYHISIGKLTNSDGDVEPISVCRLFSENYATAFDNLRRNQDQSSYFLCNRKMLSGIEDFAGPFEQKTLPGNTPIGSTHVLSPSNCAKKCRETEECISLTIWGGNCQLGMNNRDDSDLVDDDVKSYYELRTPVSAEFLGPFVGTGMAVMGGVSTNTTYSYEGSAESCLLRCQQNSACISFGWKKRWMHVTGLNADKAACYVYNEIRRTVVTAYKTKLSWDYYEKKS